uniref:Uncharacterized protein n=1 Tax=Oryza nivara TaxID=4536 RepID=A0A0E0H5K6_ORYNI
MAWWRKKVVFPARRAWAAVSTRVRARKPAFAQPPKLNALLKVNLPGGYNATVKWQRPTRDYQQCTIV